jgi:hypothetical protein
MNIIFSLCADHSGRNINQKLIYQDTIFQLFAIYYRGIFLVYEILPALVYVQDKVTAFLNKHVNPSEYNLVWNRIRGACARHSDL